MEWLGRQIERLFLVGLIFVSAFVLIRECQWWTTYRHAAELKMRAFEVVSNVEKGGSAPAPYTPRRPR